LAPNHPPNNKTTAAAADPKADKLQDKQPIYFVLHGADERNVALSKQAGVFFVATEAIAVRLTRAFASGSVVTAFVTVKGTGKFAGALELLSAPGGAAAEGVKAVDWVGTSPAASFAVKWLFETPLPFSALAHIKSVAVVSGGGRGPVTRASDGEEIGDVAGRAMLQAFEQGLPAVPVPRASSGGGTAAAAGAAAAKPSPEGNGPLDLADISYERYVDLYGRVQDALRDAKGKAVAAAAAAASGPPNILSEEAYVAQTVAMYRQRGMQPPAEMAIRMHYRQQRVAVERAAAGAGGGGMGRGGGGPQFGMQMMMMVPQQQGPYPPAMGMGRGRF
jgi:hypothetical protein